MKACSNHTNSSNFGLAVDQIPYENLVIWLYIFNIEI